MMNKNELRELTLDDLVTDVTYEGKKIGTFDSRDKSRIDELLLTDMTYTRMSKLTGMSVYEIRRYTGSIQ